MVSTCPFVCPFIRPSVCPLPNFEHNILKRNRILMPVDTSGPWGTINFGGYEVSGLSTNK